jgi:Ca2+-binding RTX toxin-like protein
MPNSPMYSMAKIKLTDAIPDVPVNAIAPSGCVLPPEESSPTSNNSTAVEEGTIQGETTATRAIPASRDRLLLAPENQIKGTKQSETVRGTETSDAMSGLDGDDTLLGLGGGDIISGDRGKDTLIGGTGGDFLYGGRGQDVLRGGRDADYLQGDEGSDILVGGAGEDQFYIQKLGGRDLIKDYVDGVDNLAIGDFEFKDLQIVQQGQNTAIRFENRTFAVLQNVQASSLTAEDFRLPLPIVA